MSDERFVWGGAASPWKVTARPGPDGAWLVRFLKIGDRGKQLDQVAAWLPPGEWDSRRWWPHSVKVPPALRQHVEAWLREHPILREVG